MKVELDETMFRLVAPDGSASELAVYGTAAMLDYNSERFYCFIEEPDDTPVVYRIDTQTEIESETADTEFEVEADEGDEEDEDEEDEETLPVEVVE